MKTEDLSTFLRRAISIDLLLHTKDRGPVELSVLSNLTRFHLGASYIEHGLSGDDVSSITLDLLCNWVIAGALETWSTEGGKTFFRYLSKEIPQEAIEASLRDDEEEEAQLEEEEQAIIALVVAARLPRNSRWGYEKEFSGDWTVIPKEDFDALQAAAERVRLNLPQGSC